MLEKECLGRGGSGNEAHLDSCVKLESRKLAWRTLSALPAVVALMSHLSFSKQFGICLVLQRLLASVCAEICDSRDAKTLHGARIKGMFLTVPFWGAPQVVIRV
eukprot:1151487-Pelagomonas_calceolata.AAC.7